MRPLCFVLMPFGKKPTSDGRTIDFDAVYKQVIVPAVSSANLEPLRADEDLVGGVIHKAMFERLILCEYAVADLTTANANVFYELGVRHAVRSWATQLIFAKGIGQLPFDVSLLRAMPYEVDVQGVPANIASDIENLANSLRQAQRAHSDSPVFQMVDGFPDIQRLKTDVFRERVTYAEKIKAQLTTARKTGVAAVAEVEKESGDITLADAAVVVDLFLSYRAVKAWDRMIDLAGRMTPPLAATVMLREQLAFALNRAGRGEEAESILLQLIEERGPSSETYGILGRVYKDRWIMALNQGEHSLAQGLLSKAVSTYLKGFESDWRDAYPGVNAVTLMEMSSLPDPRQKDLLPVVSYAVERRIASGKPDYWDYATRLELAVLTRDSSGAPKALMDALAHARESWEKETTANNLRQILSVRSARGDECCDWLTKIISQLC